MFAPTTKTYMPQTIRELRETENVKVLKRVDFETILKLHQGSQPRQGITVKWGF